MMRSYRVAAITVAVFTAGVLGPWAVSTEAADKDQNILLTLRVEVTGRTMVKVQPRDAKLWRNNPEKPHNVRWWTVNNTQYTDVYWEIRHDSSRAGNAVDYFGSINIECGQTEITVQPVTVPDSPEARWPYVVNVYGCVDGQKARQLATISPLIVWKD